MLITVNDNDKFNTCFRFNELVNDASVFNYFKEIVPDRYNNSYLWKKSGWANFVCMFDSNCLTVQLIYDKMDKVVQ